MCRRKFLRVSLALLWTTLLYLSTLPLGLCKEEDGKCSHNAVAMAMTTCQGERHKLSLASQANDTVKLCSALQQYSECMTPRIEGCKGPAKMAFDVITGKYASQPYNCKIAPEDPNGLKGELGGTPYQEEIPKDSLSHHHHPFHEDENSVNEEETRMGITDTKETNGIPSHSQHPIITQPDEKIHFLNQSKVTSDGAAPTGPGSQTETSTVKPDSEDITTTTLSIDLPGENGARSSPQSSSLTHLLLSLSISISLCLLINV